MQPDLPPFEWDDSEEGIPVPEVHELPPVYGGLLWQIATEQRDRAHQEEQRPCGI